MSSRATICQIGVSITITIQVEKTTQAMKKLDQIKYSCKTKGISTKLSKDDTKRSEPMTSNGVVSQHKPS